jgi:hypothetical protein
VDQTVVNSPATPSLAAIARQFVGQREKPGNSGFLDAAFEKAMRSIGWVTGWAYCALFCKLVAKEAGYPAWVVKLISASAVRTWNNFKRLGMTGDKPRRDSLVIWQTYKFGKPTARGHAGVLDPERTGLETFATIEANTNGAGSREGDGVYEKVRKLSFDAPQNGLRLLGFVYLTRDEQPPEVKA